MSKAAIAPHQLQQNSKAIATLGNRSGKSVMKYCRKIDRLWGSYSGYQHLDIRNFVSKHLDHFAV